MATGVPTTETAKSPLIIIDVPEEGLRQIRRWGLLIVIGSFLFGYDTGVISGALQFIQPQFGLSAGWEEVVTSAVRPIPETWARIPRLQLDRRGFPGRARRQCAGARCPISSTPCRSGARRSP